MILYQEMVYLSYIIDIHRPIILVLVYYDGRCPWTLVFIQLLQEKARCVDQNTANRKKWWEVWLALDVMAPEYLYAKKPVWVICFNG